MLGRRAHSDLFPALKRSSFIIFVISLTQWGVPQYIHTQGVSRAGCALQTTKRCK